MKIIITGATGSLGGFLTRHFSSQGNEVLAYGRDEIPPENLLKYACYFSADISKPFTFPDADLCIHTAALSDDKATAAELYHPNVTGTKNVAEASRNCKTFVHISSSSVYLPSASLITEEMAGHQNNKLLSPYGKSKLMAEEILAGTTKHQSCFILRPRAFYGAGDKVILPRLLKLVNNNTFSHPGKMQISVSLTHYENIAHAIELCANADKKGIHIYNVADDKTYILINVVRTIIMELYGEALPEKEISITLMKFLAFFKIRGITPLLVRSFTNDMVLDLSKIKRELNYKSLINLELQMKEMGDWVRSIGGLNVIKVADKKLAWKNF